MPRPHTKWIVINAVAVPAIVNGALSALIAALTLDGEHSVPVWSIPLAAKPGMVTDTLGTLFILPFLTTILLTAAVYRERRTGDLPRLDLPDRWTSRVQRLPEQPLRRALVLAGLCLAALGPLAVVALAGFDRDVSPTTFVVYKAVLGVALGLIVTPLIALGAMTDPI